MLYPGVCMSVSVCNVCVASLHREHAMLAKTAGVKHLVILVNKMDDSTVLWKGER